jgi:hypothetical protein
VLKTVITVLGVVESLAMSLPMPWRLRMGIASILGRVIGWSLHRIPGIYGFVIDRNRQFGMGKQEYGEMQSIYALKVALREMERRRISPTRIREAVKAAEVHQISNVELPRFLSVTILGEEETKALFRRVPGF